MPFGRQGERVDGARETPVRNRRHPRHREHRPDDRRDGAAARPGGRPAVHPRQPSPSRGDRQGHAAVRLHDGAGAHRGLHRRGHGRDAGRSAADAGDRHADPQPAGRSRRDDLRVAQPVRGQRHQAVRPGRLQAQRRDRGRDRGADGERHAPPPGGAGSARPRRSPGRRRRPLYRGRQGQLPARPAAGRPEDRRRLRPWRGLPRGTDRAVGTRRHRRPGRRLARRLQHQPRLRLHGAGVSLRPGRRARRATRHRAGRRRRPAADGRREGRTDRRRPDPGADRAVLGRQRPAARRRHRRHGDVQSRAGALPRRPGA